MPATGGVRSGSGIGASTLRNQRRALVPHRRSTLRGTVDAISGSVTGSTGLKYGSNFECFRTLPIVHPGLQPFLWAKKALFLINSQPSSLNFCKETLPIL